MLECMSHKEWLGWCDYNFISPIGDERQDIHAAQITAAIINSFASRPRTIEETQITWGKLDRKPLTAKQNDASIIDMLSAISKRNERK